MENPKNVDVINGDKVNVVLGGRTISVSSGSNPAPFVKIMYQASSPFWGMAVGRQ